MRGAHLEGEGATGHDALREDGAARGEQTDVEVLPGRGHRAIYGERWADRSRSEGAYSVVDGDGDLPCLVLQAEGAVLVPHKHAQHDGDGRRAGGEGVDGRQLPGNGPWSARPGARGPSGSVPPRTLRAAAPELAPPTILGLKSSFRKSRWRMSSKLGGVRWSDREPAAGSTAGRTAPTHRWR